MGNESPTPRQLFIEAVVFGSIAVVLYGGRMYVAAIDVICYDEKRLILEKGVPHHRKWLN